MASGDALTNYLDSNNFTAAPRADAAVTVANFTFTPARARVGWAAR